MNPTGLCTKSHSSGGKWLGIVNEDTVSSTKSQIVAVEFLTGNITKEDLDGSHVDLNLNGYLKREKPLSVNISADKDVEVRVESDGEALRVFVGKNKSTPVISDSLSLSYYLPQRAYVGFSASTGDNTQLSCVMSWEFSASDLDEDNRNLQWIWIIVSAVIALFIGLALSLYWKWKSYVGKGDDTGLELQIEGSSTAPRKFRLKEVEAATENFNSDNLLGRGGFGTVYKGVLENREVAVKRFSRNSHDDKQDFIAEVTTISSLHHRNLVKLVGWFHERNELILVYEFMPNKSLDKLIFCSKRNHRDIKASNVLLDSEFNARLGDFGLARTINPSDQTHHSTKAIAGTPGYMAPESLLVGRATVQTDVYAFGILVLEVVCGRKPGNQSLQNNYNNSIVDWVWENYRRGSILDVLDLQLNRVFVKEEAECVLMLALACCHPNPNHRPSMRIALRVLAGEVAPPVIPMDRPAFVWPPAMPPSSNEDLEDYSFSGDQNTPSSELIGR
ncbi:putative L-type lectin-domain containing receptor kinase S.5 [Vitis vinifera]|uniref:Putative L-type lectin-domain containing receptor kinase S.5 n=1 Tax=Vitis vinifera TaxID=29760 RepID=A0A438D5Z3_VITVI|nr:putative L-type lectin-domain containing receptor kinase S.5 [Vitis vinifera]